MSGTMQGAEGPAQAPVQAPEPPGYGTPEHFDMLQAMFKKTGEQMKSFQRIQGAFAPLMKLGDLVGGEDVIEAAGKLAAGGSDPAQLANALADMPLGGEALASWIEERNGALEASLAQLKQIHETVRHQLAVSALHGIAMDALAQHQGMLPGAQATPGHEPEGIGPSNPLSGGGGGSAALGGVPLNGG